MQGAVAETGPGRYLRAAAKKGRGAEHRRLHEQRRDAAAVLPRHGGYPQLWLGRDKNRVPCNTGDGHRMGMWVGAKLQDSPHAPAPTTWEACSALRALCC